MTIEKVVLTDASQIETHIFNHYKILLTKFFILQDNGSIDEIIPSLVTNHVNALLTIIPYPLKIKEVMMDL